jgi:lactate dehydrogenase-like 2-hydroxyacid dehydrogenase
MVLPKRLIPAAQEFYPLKIGNNTEVEKVVEETAQHAMAGLLSQLNMLAEYERKKKKKKKKSKKKAFKISFFFYYFI